MTDNDLVMFRACLEVLIGVFVFVGLLIFVHCVWEMFKKRRVRE